MSRAGKFIPGGGKAGDAAGRTGPIRAPAPGTPTPDPASTKKTTPLAKGSSLIKPVAKGLRLPIVVMSAVVCCLLVSFAWYEFALVPTKLQAEAERQHAIDIQKQADEQKAADDKKIADMTAINASKRATLIVNTVPPGANVTVGSVTKAAPATFDDLMPGTVSVSVKADGYEDYRQDVPVTVDKPTDLGTVTLTQKAGALSITSPQTEVEYSLSGPDNYATQGQVPAKLDKLPLGDYQLSIWQHDWKLPPIALTIHDQETVTKEIKFPYGNLTITSVPPGATVRKDHTILGKTPFSLNNLRPGDLNLSLDLPPYTVERFTVNIPDFGDITKAVTLQQGKDFIAACGMPMVWIPDGDFWAGKYLVRQCDMDAVAPGTNPSSFRRSNKPVETISWDAATAFCDKLTAYERKAGKLPAGYHYALPTESQWSTFSADADINQAPMSRNTTLTSTQDVGASEPNKYGLYDTLGNVWEWCSDAFDEKGNHSLRGGSWLSSSDNFPSSDTRQAAPPKYADRFIGFRVVLVPNN